jgi:hypothetical protein
MVLPGRGRTLADREQQVHAVPTEAMHMSRCLRDEEPPDPEDPGQDMDPTGLRTGAFPCTSQGFLTLSTTLLQQTL